MKLLTIHQKWATYIALLFHISGMIGICFSAYKDWFIQYTPLNILLMTVLLVWTESKKTGLFFLFIGICYLVGMGVEMIGVNTAKLFGHYVYGSVMGKKLNGVPLLIGLNWFIIIFCSASVIQQFHKWLILRLKEASPPIGNRWLYISIIIDGASLAVFFDWIMEPVAIKLGFWQWTNGEIPMYNYICWFIISTILLMIFRLFPFQRINQFAVHLFIIQLLFFLALRTF